MIVGGTFDTKTGKTSMIVKMLAKCLSMTSVNGGSIAKLANVVAEELNDDLNIWMPNVNNNEVKRYPRKKRGSILICSKVLRPDRTMHDAVARIFKMHGNAVIAIHPGSDIFKFTLIDALGNVWADTSKITTLAKTIREFEEWMKGVQRVGSKSLGISAEKSGEWRNTHQSILNTLCVINKDLADRVERAAGPRYFGNVSTRCEALFPSIKAFDKSIYVSKRNINKERLTEKDFILAKNVPEHGHISFLRERVGDKPSVDTPIQLRLYEELPGVKCMIHGHAYIADAPVTEHYYPCGDIREVDAALAILENKTMCINLRNHGFLAVGTNLSDFEDMIKNAVMLPKIVGMEKIVLKKNR